MDKPLNLKMDADVIAFAKEYAKSKGMSLSKYLEQHFRNLLMEKEYDIEYLKKYGISEQEYRAFNEEYVDNYGVKEGTEKDILKARLKKKHS